MNQKTAKLLRLYVGVRDRAGARILLQDVKRRYRAVPRSERGRVKDAMAHVIHEALDGKPGRAQELRSARPLIKRVEGRARWNVLGFLASLFRRA